MKKFTQILQHPLMKLLVSPLTYIIFGLGVGISKNNEYSFINVLLLYLIVVILNIISHFLFIKYDQQKTDKAPNFVLYTCEIILLFLGIIFMLKNHWILTILMILAVFSTHIIYYPFKFSNSFFHYILNVFFNAFIWNIIAYFSVYNSLDNKFLITLLPIILYTMSLELFEFDIKNIMTNDFEFSLPIPLKYVSILLALLGIGFGFYYSMPSHSFFLMQILFIILSILSYLPILVETKNQKQNQNKINYINSASLIFNLIYLLSYLY